MAHFRGHLGHIMAMLYVIYISVLVTVTQSESLSWHLGCYSSVSSPQTLPELDVDSTHPVVCGRHCHTTGNQYVAVSLKSGCVCLHDLPDVKVKVSESLCSTSCHGAISLPCGGHDNLSVYRSIGPYLTGSVVQALPVVYMGHVTSVEVTVELAAPSSMSLGLLLDSEVDMGLLRINYRGLRVNDHQQLSLGNRTRLHTVWQHVYDVEGRIVLDVAVSNAISSIVTKVNISVLYPQPDDLQVTLKMDDLDIPSCMPADLIRNAAERLSQTNVVYKSVRLELESLVSNGVNLTFDWSIRKVADSDGNNQNEEILMKKMYCEGACYSSLLNKTFDVVGEYRVSVRVVHSRGERYGDLYLVVLDAEIHNLEFDLEDAVVAVATSEVVQFLVSMEIASRKDLVLTVDYGNGDVDNYHLGDGNQGNDTSTGTETTSQRDRMSREMSIRGGYGEGCKLRVELQHVYRYEGVYIPNITVSNDHFNGSVELDPAIVVQPRLTEVNVPLERSVIAANEPFTLQAIMVPDVANVTLTWNITDLYGVDGNLTGEGVIVSRDDRLVHRFVSVSTYSVNLTAHNMVSNVSTQFMIQAELPISDLQLTYNKVRRYVKVGEPVTFTANVSQGSNADFEWDFLDSHRDQPQPVYGEKFSTATHYFTRPGHYNVLVKAFNAYGQLYKTLLQPIIAQDAIVNLDLNIPSAAAQSHGVDVVAMVTAGTDVHFDLDYGSGRRPANQIPDNGQVTESHVFNSLGLYNVSVYAYNEVSADNRSVCVEVQKVMDEIVLTKIFKPVLKKPVVFLVQSYGLPVRRSDVIYRWLLDGHHKAVTAAPIYNQTFDYFSQHNMTVEVCNLVSCKVATLIFNVSTALTDERRFTQGPIAVRGKTIEFTIVNIPAGPLDINAKYILEDTEDLYTRDDLNGSIFSWSHVFNMAGMYDVHVICVPMTGQQVMISSKILVEVPITDLKLSGPTAVPVSGSRAKQLWHAQLSAGSHIVYTWGLRNNFTHETTSKTYVREFRKEGVYELAVMATNALGSAAAYLNVTAQRAINLLQVTVSPTVIGRIVDINITIRGGPDFVFNIDYGDGNKTVLSAAKHNRTIVPIGGMENGLQQFRLQHEYWDTGELELVVNASNLVSYMLETRIVIVDEAITELVVTSSAGQLISSNEPINVTATVASGNNLVFDFNFGERHLLNVKNDHHTSTAQYAYTRPGQYSIKVYVSNPYYDQPIIGELAYVIHVVERMTDLTLEKQPRSMSRSDCIQLYTRESGNYSTDVLRLKASLATGSDVIFMFSFGDDIQTNVTGLQSHRPISNRVIGQARHSYKSVGEFIIKVTATNPLGTINYTLPKKLCVQVIPSGVQLDQAIYKTLHGNQTRFRVTFKAGTSLEFDWKLGDGTGYTQAISEITHTYRNPMKYDVLVTARNRVGHQEGSAIVYVQQVLRGVNLTVDHPMQKHGLPVTFTATPDPDFPQGVSHYKWDFGDPDRSFQPTTITNTKTNNYGTVGRYSVKVTAYNYQSQVTSDPIVISILNPLSTLQLVTTGEMVIGEKIVFRAYHFYGDDVTYTWKFGSETKVTRNRSVQHSFPREGEYLILLSAHNAISDKSTSKSIFITTSYCKPPEIVISGLDVALNIQRSDEISIETDVKINCSLTQKTMYNWTIYAHGEIKMQMILPNIDQRVLQDPILFLPPLSLEYGTYDMVLKATMKNEIVWSMETKLVRIIPSPLMSIIRGGLQRYITLKETVIMNASLSYDPDYPEYRDIEYKWQCCQYEDTTKPCFTQPEDEVMNHTAEILNIPGSMFRPNITAFLFNLTVQRDGRSAWSIQVLEMKRMAIIDASILCSQCQGGLNPDEKLVLQAVHPQYSESEVQYLWSLEIVQDGSNMILARVHDRGRCVNADNSTYKQYVITNMTTTAAPTSTTVAPTTASTTVVTTTTTIPRVTSTAPHRPPFGPLFPIFPVEEDLISGTGSSEPAIKGPPVDPVPQKEGDLATDDIIERRSQPNIINLERTSIVIREDMTTTGLGKQMLVLKQAVLDQGRTYIVRVTIRHKGLLLEGSALTYFRINQSPTIGRCVTSPPDGQGIEMETNFQVRCHSWYDTEMPLSYQISYSLHDYQPPDLVYEGRNSITSFHLPAGDPLNDYKVQIHICILDNLGAKTKVCSIDVSVHPKQFNVNNRTEEEILYDLVEEDGSTLQTFVQRGDNRNARLHIQLVASRLNRLQPATNNTQQLRERTRRAILWTLKDLPVRNQYEIHQMTSAVATTTAVTRELNGESMSYSTDILQKVSNQMLTMATATKEMDNSSSTLILQGASNVLQAMISEEHQGAVESKLARSIVIRSNRVVETLMKASIEHMIMGEEPVKKQTDLLYAVAGRYKKSTVPKLQTDAATFVLPSNLEKVLDTADVEGQMMEQSMSTDGLGVDVIGQTKVATPKDDCYQAHMVTFKQNPFNYGAHHDVIHTQVASLTLFTCQGRELKVNNLTETEVIDIMLPHHPHKDPEELFLLHRHQMNIHEFNLTEENKQQALHIDITLLSESTGRLFPVALLLRAGQPPEPNTYLMKWEYPVDQNNITINLNPGVLQDRVTYYIGIVDALYNEGRRRLGEVRQREYRLKLWWGQCLYWNSQTDMWSPDGCSIKSTSSYYEAHCSCSHLSSFGAHLSLAPNDLDFTNIEDFFDLHENPVTFSLIASIMILYIILLIICVRKDEYDNLKSSAVNLVDNKPKDKQIFIVTLETGFRRGAGTSAKVSIVLHGEEGMSETRELISENQQPLFERNSRDSFILTFHESLGHVFKVQIWHNNAGSCPSWFLSRVIVRDVITGHVYYFICDKWFAVEEEDEKVEREIMVSEHGLGFTKVALSKSTQYFADYHLWFSPLTRPSYSRFTRAQRLTCCLCLLLSYMAVNATWYKNTDKEYRGEFGLIDLSWRSVVVGIITSLIVLPPNMLIVLLFRRSKVAAQSDKEEQEEEKYKDAPKRDSMSSITSDAGIQPVLHTSLFDQTVVNWQHLQDWAQKTWARHQSERSTASSTEFRHLDQEEEAEADKLPIHSPGGSTAGTGSPGGSTSSRSNASSADTDKIETVNALRAFSHTKTNSDSGPDCNPTPVAPTANNQTRTKPRPPHLAANQQQGSTNGSGQGSNSGSHQGSPRSDRSTSASEVTCTTTSTEKSSQYYNRSPWSASGSDCSGSYQSSLRSPRRRRWFLPSGCRYVAWILCALVIAGCAAVTVLFGFRFGRTKSIQWLQSLFFSFLQCVFITHPFLILIASVITGIRYRNQLNVFDYYEDSLLARKVRSEFKAHEKVKGEDEECNFEKGVAARQRSRYLRFTRPPQEKQLIEARNTTIKEKKASAILSKTTLFVIQFIVLIIMAFGKDQRPVYALNTTLKANLVRSGSPDFASIKSVSDWWTWTQTHFVNSLYWENWYNGQPTDFEKEYVDSSVLVGHVNLRQLRISEQPCNIPAPFTHVPTRCHYEYSSESQSRTAFGHNTTWWHMRSESTGANGMSGKHASYDGDGFLIFLSKDRAETLTQLRYIQDEGWIDQLTRAVIIEFTLFHPPTSLFTSVKLLLELPASGGVTTTSYVTSVHLYRYMTTLDNFVLACELLFMVVTFLRLYHITVEMLHHRQDYLRHPWHWTLITQIVLSLSFIVCYIYRFILVADTVERLRATYHEVYVDVSHVEQWDHILRSLIGFISFLVLLQLLKALRYRKPFAMFENILQHAAIDLVVCALMFTIWLCAYSCLGAALYASISPLYSQPDGALLATAGLFTKHYGMADMDIQDFWGILGFRIIVASFMIFAIGSLTAYIMAVLNFHYKVFRHETILIFSNKETLLYYWDRFLVLFGLKRPILSEDDDAVLPPEFTMAEIEYQVDEMLFKMNALSGTSNLPEKPPVYFTDSDATYGAGDDGLSSGGSEVHGYEDDGKLDSRIHKIEENLLAHEPHLAQLIKLDSIGADILAHDKEKQLRSQLEMEIFRQLQLQRSSQPGGARRKYSVSNSASTGYRASLSQSSSNSSRGGLLVNQNSQELSSRRGGLLTSQNSQEVSSSGNSSPTDIVPGRVGDQRGSTGYESPSPHPIKLLENLAFSKPTNTGVKPDADRHSDIPHHDGGKPCAKSTRKHFPPGGDTNHHGNKDPSDLDPEQMAIIQALVVQEMNDNSKNVPQSASIPLRSLRRTKARSYTAWPTGGTDVPQTGIEGSVASNSGLAPECKNRPEQSKLPSGLSRGRSRHGAGKLSLPRHTDGWTSDDEISPKEERSGILRKSQSQGRGKGDLELGAQLGDFGFVNEAFDSDPDMTEPKDNTRNNRK